MSEKKKAQLMTVPEAAEALSLSEKTIWAWVHSRRLGSVKLGRSRRISADAVHELIERGSISALESR